MANEIKEAVLIWSERQLRLLKQYLPYVVIVALAWWGFQQSKQIEKMRTEHDDHLQKDIDFARDAYEKSSTAYYLMIQRQKDEKPKENP